MDIRYNKQKLAKTLKNVYELLGTPISIFDNNFGFLTSYPPEGYLTDYCRIIRESADRAAECKRCDEESCALCRSTIRTFSYICHAGLSETITPIFIENNILGYILFGEYRLAGSVFEPEEYARAQGIDPVALRAAYERLRILTSEQVEASCHILESCIRDFRLSDAILLQESDLARRIKRFIDDNIGEPITAEDICKNFFIGRTRLYSLFRDSFNTSVKQYVLEKKLARAKELLRRSEYSVAEIAERVGFSDYNNFIQRFKKRTGVTPLKYRSEVLGTEKR